MKALLTSLLFLGLIWTSVSCDNSQLPGGERERVEANSEHVTAMQNLFREHNIELSNTNLEKLERILEIGGQYFPVQDIDFDNLNEQQFQWYKAMLLLDDDDDIDLVFEYVQANMKIAIAMNEESNKLAEKWHPLKQKAIEADDTEEFNRLRELHEQERRALNRTLIDSLGLSDEKMQRFKEITQNYVAPLMEIE